jgi:hypothetical protein
MPSYAVPATARPYPLHHPIPCSADANVGFVNLKKAALADAAEKKLKGSRWLRELLRVA